MASIAQTDPRYKNGVYVNTAGQHRQRAADQRAARIEANPLCHGWQAEYWHDDIGTWVYAQFGAKMLFYNDEWYVDFGRQAARYTGPMSQITANVKATMLEVA